MTRNFAIQTLSDRNYRLRNYNILREGEGGMDPMTVILGIGGIIPSLFPNLFGSELNTRETMNKLFPGNGYWSTKYKNYLLSKIKYIKDIQRDLHQYTGEFIEQNLNAIAPNGCQGTACWQAFYSLLSTEQTGGGIQPPPNINYSTLLLVGGGVLLLLALTKKKKRTTK
jgi:hypothetical protein